MTSPCKGHFKGNRFAFGETSDLQSYVGLGWGAGAVVCPLQFIF